MKLIACYTVFDGTELLLKAIESIKDHIDGVVICWQNTSNKGKQIAKQDRNVLLEIETCKIIYGLPVNIDLFLNESTNPKENERRKHTHMLDMARKMGATHFLMAATDHFYIADEFEFGKRLVERMEYDTTFTAMYTYYKHPTWQITPIETYYMPFICKLYPETVIQKVPNFPLLVDPSVQVSTLKKWYLFKDFEVMLHHYSMVRKDIYAKFLNAASPWKQDQMDRFTKDWEAYDIRANPGIEYFKGRKVVEVPDYFDLKPIFES